MSGAVANILQGRQVKRFVADTWLEQNPSARKSTKSLCPLSLTVSFANDSFKDYLFIYCKKKKKGTSNAIGTQATKGKSEGPKESHFRTGRSSEDAERGSTSRAR